MSTPDRIPFDDFVRRHLAAEDMIVAAMDSGAALASSVTAVTDDFETGMFISALANVAGSAVRESSMHTRVRPRAQLRHLVGSILKVYARSNRA